MEILSLCTSAGLWDKAWLEAGHIVVPGCELMPHKRALYRSFCQEDEHLCHDLHDLAAIVQGQHFDGIIGGIPCQSRSNMRSFRDPKFGDLLSPLRDVLECATWDWFLFENVRTLDIPGARKVTLNAMNFDYPHQSRARGFTYSAGIQVPEAPFPGDVDSLMAYPVVMGRVYGPKRGAILQGWPEFASLPFPCVQLQEALADGVPRGLADAWVQSIENRR